MQISQNLVYNLTKTSIHSYLYVLNYETDNCKNGVIIGYLEKSNSKWERRTSSVSHCTSNGAVVSGSFVVSGSSTFSSIDTLVLTVWICYR